MSLFITFEGPEGAGKSTQVELLRRALSDRDCLVVREPGGTPLGERVRDLLLHSGPMSAEAEMLLFMAARAELLARVVKPALASGRIVIADRYHDSTFAYQGGGRGCATWWPEGFPRPDRTLLLDLPSELGLRRALGDHRLPDRLEREDSAFHGRVAQAYRELAKADPGRIRSIDASQSREEVHRQVLAGVADLLAVA